MLVNQSKCQIIRRLSSKTFSVGTTRSEILENFREMNDFDESAHAAVVVQNAFSQSILLNLF